MPTSLSYKMDIKTTTTTTTTKYDVNVCLFRNETLRNGGDELRKKSHTQQQQQQNSINICLI